MTKSISCSTVVSSGRSRSDQERTRPRIIDQADIAAAWQKILGRVRSWSDLERPLLTTVEQLIDFVTQDHPQP